MSAYPVMPMDEEWLRNVTGYLYRSMSAAQCQRGGSGVLDLLQAAHRRLAAVVAATQADLEGLHAARKAGLPPPLSRRSALMGFDPELTPEQADFQGRVLAYEQWKELLDSLRGHLPQRRRGKQSRAEAVAYLEASYNLLLSQLHACYAEAIASGLVLAKLANG